MTYIPGDKNVSPSLSNKQWVNTITSSGEQCALPLPIITQAV